MGLNARQKQAVEYLDGPLLVLAGPGTGKTQLLSEKVAYILKNTDTNPENILCMTFTETGAANMRERLKSIIGTDGAKVNINTYHAFGSDILAQYKNYAVDYDRRLDAAIDEVTQFKIVKEIQDGLNGRDILRGDAVKDITAVISAAKSA
ncbi:UvrD-helicase domain-containing protein, partial [Candidatus Saccharibacteria bacterium]|nr:UvrD-helicase domain-containing protein [Candidatus Saccharibacteria bacterium]